MDVLAAPLSAMTPLGRVPLAWQDRGMAPRQARVAMLVDDAEAEVDHSVQRALHRLADFLRREGVVVTEGARPVDSAEANEVYTHMLRAATGAHYDDAGYALAQQRARDYGALAQSHAARHFRGNTSSHRDWVKYDERRVALQRQWSTFFETHDLLICPVATTPAFKHAQQGERWERMIPVNGHTQPSTDALFWAGYPGIVGLPATAVPLGLSDEGLPIGAQIIAPLFADPDSLRLAQWLEREYRAFVPPPLALGAESA